MGAVADLFDDPIVNARNTFNKKLESNGEATCPCCQRRARVNRLKVHSTLAAMLVRLHRLSMLNNGRADAWVHIEAFRPLKHASGRDFCIVKHWNLAEPRPANEDEDKNSSGYWRLTPMGQLFVQNDILIQKHAFVFDNRVLNFSGETTSIIESLGNKFSYQELMEWNGIK